MSKRGKIKKNIASQQNVVNAKEEVLKKKGLFSISKIIASLCAFLGLLTTWYTLSEPRIIMTRDEPIVIDSLVIHLLPDGSYVFDLEILQTFYNKSIKYGFINKVEVIANGININDYSYEILHISRIKINRFSKKNIPVKVISKIKYNNRSAVIKSGSFKLFFLDNKDNQIVYNDYSESFLTIKINTKHLSPTELINNGVAFAEQGNYHDAINNFQDAININPNYLEAYRCLGRSYFHIWDYEQSIKIYQKAIIIGPEFANFYSDLGIVYDKIGNHSEAEKMHLKAIELDSLVAIYYSNLGIHYYENGDSKKAIEFLEKALQIDPYNLISKENLENVIKNNE